MVRDSANRVSLFITMIRVSGFAGYSRMRVIAGDERRRRHRCQVFIESVE